MKTAFVIMQIGNPELDRIYEEVYIPALATIEFEAKRIDLDNEGNLLKKEILNHIETADILIADLTNERPNCYLEIGYAMGLGRYKELIFTAREDHLPGSPSHVVNGPKIHFDLSGYDILFWRSNRLEDFKESLVNKINRRLSIISSRSASTTKSNLTWDLEWLESQRNHVAEKISELGRSSSMEILTSPSRPPLHLNHSQLVEFADKSQIETFGWPIGIIYKNDPTFKPIPKENGVISEIEASKNQFLGNSYDYSYFLKNGQIYIAKDLFEDRQSDNVLIPEVRIKRTTEILLYLAGYYNRCEIESDRLISVQISYRGLEGKTIYSRVPLPNHRQSVCQEDESVVQISVTIAEIEANLPKLVERFVSPLFVLFDFYEPGLNYITTVVNTFVEETKRDRF